MTPWLTPRHRHDLILSRPVAYVTRAGPRACAMTELQINTWRNR